MNNNIILNLMDYLELKQDDSYGVPLKINNVACDFCDIHNSLYDGNFIKVFCNNKMMDACVDCFTKNNLTQATKKQMIELKDWSLYKYEFVFVAKISESEYIYIVEEKNKSENIDVHYYLKIVKNKEIILDHEIQTYNPYFGVRDISIENFTEKEITIKYREKASICEVTIKYDVTTSSKNYLYSMPDYFARCNNDNVKDHEIGTITKFIKNGIVITNNTYF